MLNLALWFVLLGGIFSLCSCATTSSSLASHSGPPEVEGAVYFTTSSLGAGEKFGMLKHRLYGQVKKGLVLDALNKPGLDALFVAPVDVPKWMEGTYGMRYPGDGDIYGCLYITIERLNGKTLWEHVELSRNADIARNKGIGFSKTKRSSSGRVYYDHRAPDLFGKDAFISTSATKIDAARFMWHIIFFYSSSEGSMENSAKHVTKAFVDQIYNIRQY